MLLCFVKDIFVLNVPWKHGNGMCSYILFSKRLDKFTKDYKYAEPNSVITETEIISYLQMFYFLNVPRGKFPGLLAKVLNKQHFIGNID